MPFDAINHLCYAPADPVLALKAAGRIGWHVGSWRDGWTLSFGPPEALFQVWVRGEATAAPGVLEFGLRVTDLKQTLADLHHRGLTGASSIWKNDTGAVVAEVALLNTLPTAGVNLRLIEWKVAPADRDRSAGTPAQSAGPLTAKRLDHLAVITHDLDAKCAFWEAVLGVPRFGEVRTPSMVIRQYQIGDAIIELLGPTGTDSPLLKRTPGPAPMFAVEMADVDAAAAAAVAAGFNPPPAAAGVLPKTRIATVPLGETGGLNWQLLQYA